MEKLNRWLQWDRVQPRMLVSCGILPDTVLVLYIAFVSIYCVILFFFGLKYYHWDGSLYFRYYSELNYFLLMAYFVTAAIMSGMYQLSMARTGGYRINGPTQCNLQEKMFWVLFEIVLSNAPFVDIVFWLLVYPESNDYAGIYGISSRIFNCLFIIVELLLNQIEVIPVHVVFAVLYGIIYLLFVWVVYASTSTWVYDFLNWSKPVTPFAYVILLVLVVIFYLLAVGLSQARNKFVDWNKKRIASESFEELKKWETTAGFNSPDDDNEGSGLI